MNFEEHLTTIQYRYFSILTNYFSEWVSCHIAECLSITPKKNEIFGPFAWERINCMALSKDNQHFFFGTYETGKVIYYNAVVDEKLEIVSMTAEVTTITKLCFSPCEKFLLIASNCGALVIYDFTTCNTVGNFELQHGVKSCDISSNSEYLIASNPYGFLYGMTLGNQEVMFEEQLTGYHPVWLNIPIEHCLISPNLEFFIISMTEYDAAGNNEQHILKRLNPDTRKTEITFRGHTDMIRCCKIDPRSEKLITGSNDETVIIWDTKNGSILHRVRGFVSWVPCLAINKNGTTCIASSDGDKKMKIIDVEIGRIIKTIQLEDHCYACTIAHGEEF